MDIAQSWLLARLVFAMFGLRYDGHGVAFDLHSCFDWYRFLCHGLAVS